MNNDVIKMEMVNVTKLAGSRCANVTKQVPIITDEVYASLLFIHPYKKRLNLQSNDLDMIHYIIKGSGEVTVDDEASAISEGSLILIPKNKPHFYSTTDNELVVLSVRSIKEVNN
jgi:quercetin dioxygenase-like cupin family protein